MTWSPIELLPGLNVELTPAALRAGYSAMDFGRWKAGKFQKLGGWTKYYPLSVGGYPRCSHAWEDLANNQRYGIGTTTELIDITNDKLTEVTPQTLTTSAANPNFTTTIGSNIVTVIDTSVTTITPSDSVLLNTPISVDGIILYGLFQIASYVSSTSYTIIAPSNALAGVSNGGAVPAFTTASGSSNVTVTFADHGLSVGGDIILPLATTVGGIVLQGRYVVTKVTDADNFVVISSVTASSTAGPTSMNSGHAGFLYYLTADPTPVGGAYGTGTYGSGYYGTGQTASGQSGTKLTTTDWTIDNWGELLMASPVNGGLYYWGPSSGYGNVQLVGTAPPFNTGMFMSTTQQMIICYGSTVDGGIGVYQDPLLIRWCDVGDFFTWQGTTTNQAGQFRLSQGSRIIGGGATPTMNLIWTDQDLWEMTYIGSQFVFGFHKSGANCGLIAKHAWTSIGGSVYWMTPSAIFQLSGGAVSKVNCPIWDAIFQDLDTSNVDKCHAGSNSLFGEVEFYYPSLSGGLGICDKRATFNVDEGLWSLSSIQRNTWIDVSGAGNPISADNSGAIYQHETGNDADTSPMNPWFETGWIYINEGEDVSFIDRVFPDFKWGEYNGIDDANIQITVSVVKYLGDTPVTYGPFNMTKLTKFVSKRMRGRHVKFKVESNDMGSFWRIGHMRMRWMPDGKN